MILFADPMSWPEAFALVSVAGMLVIAYIAYLLLRD